MVKKLPSCVTRELGHYVYLYVDPETKKVFYVGKGKGNRMLSHASGRGKTRHDAVIRKLRRRRLKPQVEVLIHGLKSEEEALAVEMAAIDLLGLENLTNEVGGHHSSRRGRMSLDQLIALYQRKKADIREPVILIRIARAYRYGMSPVELYDATRATWKVGGRRKKAKYVLSVHDGIVREVYWIADWLPSGSTLKHNRPEGDPGKGRWEFVGKVAEEKVRHKYLNHSVVHYFREHSQNPIRYVNCRAR